LLEFELDDVLIYPLGSNVPKRMRDKIKISPSYIIKHLLELQLFYNIKVVFCGDSDNAAKMAEFIFKKVNYIERNKKEA
ncbi:MAG: hypothetical protein WD512_20035, partial [Candidatus Paceibacterota bacterium]